MTSRVLPLTCLAAAAAVFMAACSGGDGTSAATTGDGSTAETPIDTDAIAPLTTDPIDPLVIDPLTTDPPPAPPVSTVAPAEELPELEFTSLRTGPLQLDAMECVIEGLLDGGPMAGASSLAIDATRAFLPVSDGVAAFALDTSTGCTLSIDTAIGDGGVLVTTDPTESVAVSATGRLAATGLSSTTVFDLSTGQSYSCDGVTGEVDITSDGARLMTSLPGSPIEQYSLSDTGCASPTEVTLPADLVDRYYVAYDGADLFVGGSAVDQAVSAGRVSDGAFQWRIGNVEPGGPGWIGWVHGIVPCAGGFCVLDTNTDKLIVTDALGGLRAEFAVTDLIGARMFHETLELGVDGALYLLTTTSAPDGAGGRTEAAHLVRIEVTG